MAYQLVSKSDRKGLNFYPTPYDLIEPVRVMIGREAIWEPACGDGRIVRVFREAGNPVFASDIEDHGFGGLDEVRDFYAYDQIPAFFDPYDSLTIITNPPHSREHATKFVQHCLDLARASGKDVDVFLLLRHQWDTAKTRIDLCRAVDAKITMCWRPKWFEDEEGAKSKTPMHNYAWYYWEDGGQGECKNVYIGPDWNKT